MASLSSNSFSTTIEVDNIIRSLQCPVEFQPMVTAVSLAPCMHKINETAAKNLFGSMPILGEKYRPCPICRKNITAYYPDPAFRSIVATILKKPEEILPLVSAKLAKEPREDWKDIPFPGIGAKFVHSDGDWKVDGSGGDLIRRLEFQSMNPDTLFQKMSVLGYENGSVRISLCWKDSESETIRGYFSNIRLSLVSFRRTTYKSLTKEEAKILFAMIATYNEIPEEYFPLIRSLIEKGDWREVTPLTAEEEAIIAQRYSHYSDQARLIDEMTLSLMGWR